jgi:phosphopantothenoylcysteine decarboxylase/phosphopantothenate--cysteine ligase
MNKKILLGVTGSIAAYKSADLVSRLMQTGYDVTVVMTANAARFITPLTLEALSKNKVYVDMFDDEEHSGITHISLATESDIILVAPATFNIIGKTASGLADDLLSSILAAAPSSKVIFAPAMNVNMYSNNVTVENIKKLSERGYTFIEPEEGALACGALGKGRLRNVPDIIEVVKGFLYEKKLKDKKVLITAGATREYFDPIRFLSNSSSGLMGVSLAKACRNMGADVTLVIANSNYDANVSKVIRVDTVDQMYDAALSEYTDSDIVFSVAAVSDFKPKARSDSKIKKSVKGLSLELDLNKDILYEMGRRKKHQFLVGFAAESESLFENAKFKLENKNLDVIIANQLSNFASSEGKVWLISPSETSLLELKLKEELAYDIVNQVVSIWQKTLEEGPNI